MNSKPYFINDNVVMQHLTATNPVPSFNIKPKFANSGEQFLAEVSKIQTEKKLDYDRAWALASKTRPELLAAMHHPPEIVRTPFASTEYERRRRAGEL